MYFYSREDWNGDSFNHQYHIGYTVVFMAMLGPYIIQYSSMINAIY